MTERPIIGAFGGGQAMMSLAAPTPPSVQPDNLESKQFARIIDLLSEGEIEGFPSARDYTRGTDSYNRALLKDVYINETPLVRAGADASQPYQDADYNFKGITITPRYGTQDQAYLTEVGTSTQEEVTVNTKVLQLSPITRSVTDPNVNGVRVTISVPQLQEIVNRGDVYGTSVQLEIRVSYGGGPFTTVITDTIAGRTNDLYQRKYRIDLTQPPPVDIRVVRITGDSYSNSYHTINSDIYWAAYTELIYAKTRYPNSAVVGLLADAEQFSSIPNRSYRIRGIKVAIPSNATVDSSNGRLIYSGIWDGTFQSAKWTTDPAWCLWDLLVSTRYGWGDYITAESLDKWSFYTASVYSSALVPDGFGGQEPRFSCNVNIQTQEEAYKLINDLCSVFRAQPFWSTGSLSIAQDRPTDATFIFNQSNVTPEGFSYSGSSLKTRHTVAVVSYLDLDIRDTAYEVVEDKSGIVKFGYNKVEVSAFACTSRGQARRVGEWLLYAEQRQSETISFTTGIAEGSQVRPGQIIRVADPVKAGRVRAGRIAGGTAQVLTLDRSTEQIFTDGTPTTFDFNVMLPTGVSQSVGGISGSALSGTTLTLPTALDLVPPVGAMWAIGTSTLSPQLYRVLTVQEQDQGQTFAITALLHEQGKYDYIERDVPLQTRDVTELDVAPATPAGLSASEVLYESNGQVLSKVIVGWRPVSNAPRYILRYRYENNNWTTVTTRSPDYEILNSGVGRYYLELQAESSGFKRSGTATASFDALGKTAPPETIPELFIAPIDDKSAELYWPQAVDLDVRIGGQVRIRHTPEIGVNATWGRANDIVPAVAGSSTRKIVPLLEGTYIIRAVDSTGNESTGVASVVVDLPAPQDTYLIQEYREDDDSPPFQGSATSMFYSAEEGGLTLTATGLIDDIPDWDTISSVDFYGDTSSSGSYQFLSTLDLTNVFDIDLLAILKTRAFQPGNAWDERTLDLDDWNDIDGDDLSDVNAQLYVRTTADNPSGTPTWSDWQPFVNGTTRGRGFQFRVDATSHSPSQNILIEQLGVTTKLQRRTETQRNISSGAAAYTVTYPSAFYDTPSIGITAQNMATGDYFTVSSASRTGFTVTFRNTGGSMVSKTFDYQAVGHGRQIT